MLDRKIKIGNDAKLAWCQRRLTSSVSNARKAGYMPCTATAQEVLAAWTGECHHCGEETSRLCLDHCHATGKFRAWLCRSCNALTRRTDLPVPAELPIPQYVALDLFPVELVILEWTPPECVYSTG